MRRTLAILLLLLTACSGDDDTASDDSTSADDSSCPALQCPEGGVLAAEISESALPTCSEVETRYADVVAAASSCACDEDCQRLYGACDVGLGGCYEAVNTCIDQSLIGELGTLYDSHSQRCVDAVCDCEEPQDVACVEGSCVFVAR
ncbi:MAG: hypothetical protein H6739_07630 [Alphaproteobacteria bacterium]|nr:hypothetical protein [Alphaproteobacteria bacterium]